MSNSRVKSLAHDDDDFDDYGDFDDEYEDGNGNDLSSDDKEQMRQGTITVRAALGAASSVTDSEIQEALWHYYYDIAKSVAYLKSGQPSLVSCLEWALTSSDKQKPPPTATKKQATQNKSKSAVVCSPVEVLSGRGGHDSLRPSRFRKDADEHQDPIASVTHSNRFSV